MGKSNSELALLFFKRGLDSGSVSSVSYTRVVVPVPVVDDDEGCGASADAKLDGSGAA